MFNIIFLRKSYASFEAQQGGMWVTSKKITSAMINVNNYADFMIKANKNADSMFNTKKILI